MVVLLSGGGHTKTDSTDQQLQKKGSTGWHPSTSSPSPPRCRGVGVLKVYLFLTCITLQYLLVNTYSLTNHYYNHGGDDDDDDDVLSPTVLHRLDSQPAKRCQFPHIVLLHIQGHLNIQCAGSLVDRRHVVTSAHCLNHGPKKISAHFGSVNTIQMPIQIPVDNYTMHEDFVRRRKYLLNDVAILKLREAVNISECIKPIPLATQQHYYQGQCIVAGWGVKTYFGPLSTRLHYTALPIVPLKHCQALSPYLQDQHLCAGELRPDGRTTCKGDSGSPLMCFDAQKKERVLVGIVSYGWKCKTGLSVYARVSYFNKWILKHIQ